MTFPWSLLPLKLEMQRTDQTGRQTELLTLPAISRIYGVGYKALRRAAARGDFPIYTAGTSWPRAMRSEFEVWLRSTQIAVSGEDRA